MATPMLEKQRAPGGEKMEKYLFKASLAAVLNRNKEMGQCGNAEVTCSHQHVGVPQQGEHWCASGALIEMGV